MAAWERGPLGADQRSFRTRPFDARLGHVDSEVDQHEPQDERNHLNRPAAYGQQKRDEYTDNDYHAPSDEVKPDWDLSGAVEDLQLLFAVGYRVANADKFPEWKPGNEFRAKREEMLRK